MTDYRTQPINQKNADFVEHVADRIEEMQLEGRSLWQDAKRRFFRNKAAVVSLIILAFRIFNNIKYTTTQLNTVTQILGIIVKLNVLIYKPTANIPSPATKYFHNSPYNLTFL